MVKFSHVAVRLLLLCLAASACVQDRPARNGVFNENQYLRKDFLIQAGNGATTDPGWFVKATVVETSSPNPLGGEAIDLFPGLENGGAYVRFRVTQDKLEMVSLRELGPDAVGKTQTVINSWPATNVDLKFRVNLDGENTNFYEENQELDWDVRQWVKLQFNVNDGGDLLMFGPYTGAGLQRCTDLGHATVTLVPDSYYVLEDQGYFQWIEEISLPLQWNDDTCYQEFGAAGDTALSLGRSHVTLRIMFSMMRANPAPTYQPLQVQEKDPIHHKYGPIEFLSIARDPDSGLLAARSLVMRFDPKNPMMTWYFAQGYPEAYKKHFTDKNGIVDQTNAILTAAGATLRMEVKNFDQDLAKDERPRQYGDIRYNFLRWMSDKDTQDTFAGVAQFITDPRTGETLSASINLNDFAIKDEYVQRIDFYLQQIGASANINSADAWPDLCPNGTAPACRNADDAVTPCAANQAKVCAKAAAVGTCAEGAVAALDEKKVVTLHNTNSSLFGKMQEYLQKPVADVGPLGPKDFIAKQDQDFYNAYYAVLPYWIYADPWMNLFVMPEGQDGVYGPEEIWKSLADEAEFHKLTGAIDHGKQPIAGMAGKDGLANTAAFLNKMKKLTRNHVELPRKLQRAHSRVKKDVPAAFSFLEMMKKNARHCVGGKWETKEQWTQAFIDSYWSQVMWHEFGHVLGLEHNFMASVDRPNFPTYKIGDTTNVSMYSSSVMEYNAAPDRVFWHPGFGPYDAGAIAWIYANTQKSGKGGSSISGQVSATAPWNDPLGFNKDGKETQFLYCSHQHLQYTPLCRMGDSGTTPSEIIANDIDRYEWQYQWTNFRVYRKFWDLHAYADAPATMITELRRFLPMWTTDWAPDVLVDAFRRVGVVNPAAKGSDVDYYDTLVSKFNKEASQANQMMAAFHKAVIQQSSGERPFSTTYDKFYGDVTQQGIILDKLFAMQAFVGLWPIDNYDLNQTEGYYMASFSEAGDASYNAVAEDVVASMIGGQYDVYPYFKPLAVAQFAADTHDPAFSGRIEMRDWIGGKIFEREQDFLDFFRSMAVKYAFGGCTALNTCKYDPQTPAVDATDTHHSDTYNEFIGPDGRRYIWAYIANRNQWVAVDRDRNIASYLIVRAYTADVINQQDDGGSPGFAYDYELEMKYFLDAFTYYN